MNFYLLKDQQTLGPYSSEQIRIFLGQGLFTPADLVWAERWPSWVPIGDVPSLTVTSHPIGAAPPLSSTGYAAPAVFERSSFQQNNAGLEYAERKNPFIDCVLSLAIVGAGQFYNGDWSKGWCLLITCIICSIFSLGVTWMVWALFSAHDAYRVAIRAKPLTKMFPYNNC